MHQAICVTIRAKFTKIGTLLLREIVSRRLLRGQRSGVVGAMSGSTQTPSEAESRIATTVWFKATQHSSLKRPDGAFVEWFHGIIPRMYVLPPPPARWQHRRTANLAEVNRRNPVETRRILTVRTALTLSSQS